MTRGIGPATAISTRPAISADGVLDAAEALIEHGGFEQLSVRAIAADLGVSRQVVYTHFGGMNGLLDGLHRRLSSRLSDAVAAVAGDVGSTDHLLDAAAAYRDVARRWPALYQLAFERPVADHVVGAVAVREGRRSFSRIVEMSRGWLARARNLDPTDDESVEFARAIWSVMHGFVVLERVGFATVAETDALSERAIRSMLDGWV